MSQANPQSSTGAKLPKEEYRKACEMAYQHFDSNKDGKLTKEEFNKMYGAISKQLDFVLTDQIMDFLYAQIGKGQNDGVKFDDLHKALEIFYYK